MADINLSKEHLDSLLDRLASKKKPDKALVDEFVRKYQIYEQYVNVNDYELMERYARIVRGWEKKARLI